MKILVAHNRYLYRGGEDTVVDAEVNLLRQRGHQVWVYSRDNTEIQYLTSIKAAKTTFWSRQTVQELQKINQQFSPDLIHAHNTFPLISPSLYGVAQKLRIGIPKYILLIKFILKERNFFKLDIFHRLLLLFLNKLNFRNLFKNNAVFLKDRFSLIEKF